MGLMQYSHINKTFVYQLPCKDYHEFTNITLVLKRTYYPFRFFPFPCYIAFSSSKLQSPKYTAEDTILSHIKHFSQLPETPLLEFQPCHLCYKRMQSRNTVLADQ